MEDVLQDSDGMETVGKEGPEKTAARALGGQQKDAVPTKCFADSTRKKRERTKINKIINEGFPGVAVVESPPASAGDTGSSPGLGGSHMPRSSWAREPQLLSLRVWSLCSAPREAATVRGPLSRNHIRILFLTCSLKH